MVPSQFHMLLPSVRNDPKTRLEFTTVKVEAANVAVVTAPMIRKITFFKLQRHNKNTSYETQSKCII
jgi:hypothetical protein